MELNKNNIKKIILLMICAGFIIWTVINTSQALATIGWFIRLINPLLLGFGIAFVLNVLMRGIEDKAFKPIDRKFTGFWWKIRRSVSLTASILILTLLVCIMMALLVPAVKDAWSILSSNFPSYWKHLQEVGNNLANRWDVELPMLPDFTSDPQILIDKGEKFLTGGITSVFGTAFGIMTSLVGKVLSGLIGIVIAIYMLSSKEKLQEQAGRLVRAYFSENTAKEIFYIGRTANRIFSSFIVGQVTDATILGCTCLVCMLILKIPYAAMIAILLGFTALIPIFGAFIGTGIGAFLILMNSPIKALWFIIMVLVIQQIDGQLIYPRVVGSSVGLPALWTLLAVLMGGTVGGLLGMLCGVPIAALAYTLLRRATNRRLEAKNMTVNTIKEK